MRTPLTALAISVLLGASPYYATAAGQAGQQQKCDAQAQAQQLIGDIRDSYMRMCMGPINTSPAQEAKMKKCHADATSQDYHGDELTRFVATCMTQ